MLTFNVGVFTDCGVVKSMNEDSFNILGRTMPDEKRSGAYGLLASKREFGIAAIFDGMGGKSNGEIASGICAKILTDNIENIMNYGSDAVNKYVLRANAAVCAKANEMMSSMGSTMVMMAVSDATATVYNIGDSRAYIVRSGAIKQITKDHTMAASLNSIGINNNSAGKSHKLTQHIGIPESEMLIQAFSMGSFKLREGDKVLLCSDGVTDGLSDRQILDILNQEKSVVELTKELTYEAEAGGSADNVTAMVFTFTEEKESYERAFAAKQRKKSPASDRQKNKFWLIWPLSTVLALLLGVVAGVLYNLI